MNEQLQELASQSWHYADKQTHEGDNRFASIQLEEFAKLIINKAAEVMEDQDYFYGEWMGRIVKKYFGVVECR